MSTTVRVCVLGGFHVYADGENVDRVLGKSRKGRALLQYLILRHGENVPIYRLIDALWDAEPTGNPESAIKTLVSRLRAILSRITPELGACIATERGCYRWECQEGVSVDLMEFELLDAKLRDCAELNEETEADYRRVLALYVGGLLADCEQKEWIILRSSELHRNYMRMVYRYLHLLDAREDFGSEIAVCRAALDVDAFDEQLHQIMMSALMKTNRPGEAMAQYRHATDVYSRYTGTRPSEGVQQYYTELIGVCRDLRVTLDDVRDALLRQDSVPGPMVCEYGVLGAICQHQSRLLKRRGELMRLGMVMLQTTQRVVSPLKQDTMMRLILKLLLTLLHPDDTVARFSASQYVFLMPSATTEEGRMLMHTLRERFYRAYPASDNILLWWVRTVAKDDEGEGEDE